MLKISPRWSEMTNNELLRFQIEFALRSLHRFQIGSRLENVQIRESLSKRCGTLDHAAQTNLSGVVSKKHLSGRGAPAFARVLPDAR